MAEISLLTREEGLENCSLLSSESKLHPLNNLCPWWKCRIAPLVEVGEVDKVGESGLADLAPPKYVCQREFPMIRGRKLVLWWQPAQCVQNGIGSPGKV